MRNTFEYMPECWELFTQERAKGSVLVSLVAFAKVVLSKASAAAGWLQAEIPTDIDSVYGGLTKVEDLGAAVEIPSSVSDPLQKLILQRPTPKICQQPAGLRSFADLTVFA